MKPATVIAFDKKTARFVDSQGFLHVQGCNISKNIVNPYLGVEIPGYEQHGLDPAKVYHILRPAEELKKAAPSFNNLPLMDGHVEVSSFDLENPDIKKRVVGSTGQCAEFKAPYLVNDLVVWTEGAKCGIDSKEQVELSCAYKYDLDFTPGEFEGQPYDGIMRNIVGNHVALVEEGRAGHDVRVADSKPDKLRVKVDVTGIAEAVKAAFANDFLSSDVVERLEGHKNSKGEPAPWVIRGHKGNIIASAANKEEIAKHMRRIEGHKAGAQEDENPEGINQYTYASGRANVAGKQAGASSAKASKSGSRADHFKASTDHQTAATYHRLAAQKSPGSGMRSFHEAQQAKHEHMASQHMKSAKTGHDDAGVCQPVQGLTLIKSYITEKMKPGVEGELSKVLDDCTAAIDIAVHHLIDYQEELDAKGAADIAKREEVNPKSGTEKYGKVEFADPKNKKFPIDTPEHVRSAASYWGQAKNRKAYSKEDQASISKRIDSAKRRFKIGEFAEQ